MLIRPCGSDAVVIPGGLSVMLAGNWADFQHDPGFFWGKAEPWQLGESWGAASAQDGWEEEEPSPPARASLPDVLLEVIKIALFVITA